MNKELMQIVSQLNNKSNKGEVVWSKSSSPNEYLVRLDIGTIITRVYSVKGMSGMLKKVECTIENKRGDVLLRESALIESEDGVLLHSLYDSAFRSYTGKDAVIRGILGELSTDGKKIGEADEDIPF